MSLLKQCGGELQAQMIKDAIASRYDIDLDHVRITGDLIISAAEAAKIFAATTKAKISFEKPICIESQMRFIHCIFEGIVDFANTRLCQEVIFDGSHFKENVYFCPHSGGIPLRSAEFQRQVSFHNAHFYKYADFNSVNFRDKAKFQEAEFREFSNHVDFCCANFGGDVNFVMAHFLVKAEFLRARFHGITIFSNGTVFNKDANFADTIFYERVRFFGCHFKNNANFREANFDRDVVLSRSNFDRNFILSGTRIKIMKLDGVSFSDESSIFLKDAYFDRLLVEWETIKDHLTEQGNDDAVFLALIKNFNDLGRSDDADECKLYYKTKFKK